MKRARRSELSTPASNDDMMRKAASSNADHVFLDLEDSVAPNAKDAARGRAVHALLNLDWRPKTRAVRINPLDTPHAHQDIIDVVTGAREALDVVIIPKARHARDVWWVSVLLDQLEQRLGLTKKIGLEVLIEETGGLAHVDDIAFSSERLEALIFGPGDFAASQGVPIDNPEAMAQYPGDIWHYARTRVVVAARSAGIVAVDGPFAVVSDPEGYAEQARYGHALGFTGKWAIHPSQIGIANEIYGIDEQELARARAITRAYAQAQEQGQGAITYDGEMLDAASVRIARNVVDKAELIGR